MSKLNINIESGGQEYTVSEMRRRLAQVLSKLNGDQKVTFSFRAELPNYEPTLATRAAIWHANEKQVIETLGLSVVPARTPYATFVLGELARPEND